MAILSNEKRDVSVSENFNTSGFKIQASAKAFEILSSNIYTNKVRAVIREYNCNAYDAHIDAGTDRPWDVHLPTVLEPWYSVRDFGTGLSDEQVRETFSTYFCSTKTHSNEFVGALGLGSKSAFSIVDSFTVVSYYNGTKTDYSCYKDEYGEPQVASLVSCETDEPNGLEISMSVDGRQSEFEREAVKVFRHFDSLPNINDQEVVNSILAAQTDYDFIAEGMSLRNNWGDLYAVMGNVGYKIPNSFSLDLCGFIEFEIGELSFNAGREELSLDDSTKIKLEKRISEVTEDLAKIIYDKISAESCSFKQSQMKESAYAGSIKSNLSKSSIDFHVFDLPKLGDSDGSLTVYSRSYSGTDITQRRSLPVGDRNGWTTRYCLHKDRMKTRIQSWMKNQRNVRLIVLTQKQVDFFGVPADLLEDLEDFVPKIERGFGGGSSARSRVCKWSGVTPGWRVKAGSCWQDVEVDNDGQERVYVQIDRYAPTNCSWTIDCFKNVLDSTDHLGFGVDVIYGLKTSFFKTKAFKSGNWISLDEYVKRETANLPEITVAKYDRWNVNYKNLFEKLGKLVDCPLVESFNNALKSIKDEHSDKFAYNTLFMNKKIKYEDILEGLAEKVVDRYNVINLLSSCGDYASPEQVEIIANHIKGVK